MLLLSWTYSVLLAFEFIILSRHWALTILLVLGWCPALTDSKSHKTVQSAVWDRTNELFKIQEIFQCCALRCFLYEVMPYCIQNSEMSNDLNIFSLTNPHTRSKTFEREKGKKLGAFFFLLFQNFFLPMNLVNVFNALDHVLTRH